MTFTVYTHFKNIPEFQKYVPIQCYPEKQSQYDVPVSFLSKDIIILSNQSGLYICKKKGILQKFLDKLHKKK